MNTCKRKTGKQRQKQKSTRKIHNACLSRLCVDEFSDNHVNVVYFSAHTNHQVGPAQVLHLPLPKSTQDEVALRLAIV